MNFKYSQSTGNLFAVGSPVIAPFAQGYSGNGDGKNNPDLQCTKNIGPIPMGWYTMQPPVNHPKVGEVAIRLIPNPANNMCGRTDFMIHGDSLAAPGWASDGCIILDKGTRIKLGKAVANGDDQLEVVRD